MTRRPEKNTSCFLLSSLLYFIFFLSFLLFLILFLSFVCLSPLSRCRNSKTKQDNTRQVGMIFEDTHIPLHVDRREEGKGEGGGGGGGDPLIFLSIRVDPIILG
jgi:hypothetical protein